MKLLLILFLLFQQWTFIFELKSKGIKFYVDDSTAEKKQNTYTFDGKQETKTESIIHRMKVDCQTRKAYVIGIYRDGELLKPQEPLEITVKPDTAIGAVFNHFCGEKLENNEG